MSLSRLWRNNPLGRIRRRVPAKAWAAMTGTRIPSSVVRGRRTAISRPEAIAIARSDNLMAVCNFASNCLTTFGPRKSPQLRYHRRPQSEFSDAVALQTLHDVAFSPCGQYLAVAARDIHTVSIYARCQVGSASIEHTPRSMLRGRKAGISHPAAVAFHPSGDWLAVASRKDHGVTIVKLANGQDDAGVLNSEPSQRIPEQHFLDLGLSNPCGLDFSADGDHLVVAHSYSNKSPNDNGNNALSIYAVDPDRDRPLKPDPLAIHPLNDVSAHHVAVHPRGQFILLANERNSAMVFRWSRPDHAIELVDTISIVREFQTRGVKGATFTPDGEQIAISTEAGEVLFFANWRR